MKNIRDVAEKMEGMPSFTMEGEYAKADPQEYKGISLPQDTIDDLISTCRRQKTAIDNDRSEWLETKNEFIEQWDNFRFDSRKTVCEGVTEIKLPTVFEKMQNWQVRTYQAIFSPSPFFSAIPTAGASADEIQATTDLMFWYLMTQLNEREGIKPFMSELLWDIASDGWAISFRSWKRTQRVRPKRQPDNKEQLQKIREFLKIPSNEKRNAKKVLEVIQVFNGQMIETVPHESVYFPANLRHGFDLQSPEVVMLEREYSEDDLLAAVETGAFDEDQVQRILNAGSEKQDGVKQHLRHTRENVQGVRTWHTSTLNPTYPLFTVFMRADLLGHRIPQEYVFTASLEASAIPRFQFLDSTIANGRRPIAKYDLVKRSRSAYSIGFPEMLNSFAIELNEIHNFRRANGYFSSVPWGFFNPQGGLEKERIVIKPGVFLPLSDPRRDYSIAKFGNTTAWPMQEEGLLQSYADKLASQPATMRGGLPDRIGPLRSTSGVMAMNNEASAPMEMNLEHIRFPLSAEIQGVHEELKARLPNIVTIMVLGKDAMPILNEDGSAREKSYPKTMIGSSFRFMLSVASANFNPAKEYQDAMGRLQLLMSPAFMQTGLVTPANLYAAGKEVLEKSGRRNIDDILTQPQNVAKPLNLFQEYNMCIKGRMPVVVLNDEHKAKVQGLSMLLNSQEFQAAVTMDVASPLAPQLLKQVIEQHQEAQKLLDSLPAVNNQSGLQQPLTLGSQSEPPIRNQQEGTTEPSAQKEPA